MENPSEEQSTETKEKPRVVEAFSDFTGVETTESDEVVTFRVSVVKEAKEFLKPFREKGLITEETEREVLDIWGNLTALDADQLQAYEKFHTGIYRQAVEDLSECDPDGTNEEVQTLITQARQLIKINERDFSMGLAFTCRANPAHAAKAKETGMPERWIMVNWGRKNEIAEIPYRTKATVYEETAHLISRLSDYDGIVSGKWVDEMMARVIAFGMPSGHIKEDPDYPKVYEEMRAEGYLGLFYAVTKMTGDEQALLRMFFGSEPHDSEAAKKAGKALDQFSLIGEIIDAGVSMKALREHMETKGSTGKSSVAG